MHVITAEDGPNNMSYYEDVNCKTKKGGSHPGTSPNSWSHHWSFRKLVYLAKLTRGQYLLPKKKVI